MVQDACLADGKQYLIRVCVTWCRPMPRISALRRLRQEDGEFEIRLSYTVMFCLKTKV